MNIYLRIIFSLFLTAFVSSVLFTGCGGAKKIITIKSSDEYYKQGMDFFNRKKYLNAITEFQGIVYNYPGDARVDSAQYYLALSYFNDKNHALAQVEFDRLLVSYPSSPLAEASQFMRAASLFEGSPKSPSLDQTDLKAAVKQLDEFLSDNPESPYLPEAKAYLNRGQERLAARVFSSGMVYYRIHAYDASQQYLQQVIDDYTSTSYAPKALFQLAEVSFARGNYQKAVEQYGNFATAFPEHELAARTTSRKLSAEKRLAKSHMQVDSLKTQALMPADSSVNRGGE